MPCELHRHRHGHRHCGQSPSRAAGSRPGPGPAWPGRREPRALGRAGRRARWGRGRRARAPRGGSAGPGPALSCAAGCRCLNSGACRAALSLLPLRGKGPAPGALRRTRFLYRGSLRLCCRGGAGGRQAGRERTGGPGPVPRGSGAARAGGRDRGASSRGCRHSVFSLLPVCVRIIRVVSVLSSLWRAHRSPHCFPSAASAIPEGGWNISEGVCSYSGVQYSGG